MPPPTTPPTTTNPNAASATTTSTSTIDTSIPAINSFAVELDSTPVSPVLRKPDHASHTDNRTVKGTSPEEEEEAYEEMTGEKGEGGLIREKRKQLLADRAKDPAVLVDIPPTPRAEEYEVAEEAKMAGTTGAVAAARLKRDEAEIVDRGSGS